MNFALTLKTGKEKEDTPSISYLILVVVKMIIHLQLEVIPVMQVNST